MTNDIKKAVREGYAKVAQGQGSCCGPQSSCCSGPSYVDETSKRVGYTDTDLQSVPDGANLGLGCGNPIAIASLKPGETVLDLGAGAGFDCFLAANQVGPTGKVIGVDMTPEMLDKARANAQKGGYGQVEFRLGEIENLPVANNTVNVVISNCVINLSTDKKRVFAEAYRVLKNGGRLMVSDIVLLAPLPTVIQNSVGAYIGCISGALPKEDYLDCIQKAGFSDVVVQSQAIFPIDYLVNDPTVSALVKELVVPLQQIEAIAQTIVSIKVSAVK